MVSIVKPAIKGDSSGERAVVKEESGGSPGDGGAGGGKLATPPQRPLLGAPGKANADAPIEGLIITAKTVLS